MCVYNNSNNNNNNNDNKYNNFILPEGITNKVCTESYYVKHTKDTQVITHTLILTKRNKYTKY